MKADYDSEADALSILLATFKRYDNQEAVDEDNCHVGIVGGRAVDISLLYRRGISTYCRQLLADTSWMTPPFLPSPEPPSRPQIAS
jgi:hypothetical protein